jgi:tetratricopeptide (TPR) repeat protein
MDNHFMVYVIAELRNYKQLARLRAAGLPALEAGLAAALGPRAAAAPAAAGAGVWMAEIGAEDTLDRAAAIALALKTRDFLFSRRADLFGFAVFAATLPPAGDAGRVPRLRALLSEAEADDKLWLTPECAALIGGWLTAEPAGSLLVVTGEAKTEEPAAVPLAPHRPWTREGLVSRALDIIAARIHSAECRDVLMVHGPPGVGKSAVLTEVAARLMKGDAEVPVLRTRTVFKRRSPLHPFLSSLQPALLAAVPRHLRGPERAAWEDVRRLLSWLHSATAREQGTETIPLSDRALEDFGIGYRLYLLAWARVAEERLRPALLVCEGIESYHPAARRILAEMCGEMLALPAFVPLLSSTEARPPEELAGLDVRPLYVHPMGKREIRSLAQHLFPGLEIPESLARRLRGRSGGLYVSAVSALQYLRKTGHIVVREGQHRWAAGGEVSIPANPLSVSWYLVRTLKEDTFLLLYALYLAGGLLDRPGFLAFLAAAGLDTSNAEQTLDGLLVSGLMMEEGSLIPRFPALRRKLEEQLDAEGRDLFDRFVKHLAGLWNTGRYRHPVLLFTFLARNGRTDLALQVLPHIIRRKLDENDVAGARAFCDPRGMSFSTPPTREQARALQTMTAAGRLRAALLADEAHAAEAANAEAQRCIAADPRGALDSELYVERAKFFLSTGNAAAALSELKQALLLHQEARDGRGEKERDLAGAEASVPRGERACYLWLGATMLAEGRIGEAVEYLALSDRFCHAAGDAPAALWTQAYLAGCLFIDCRYTQCLAVADQGLQRARLLYRRELDLYLQFLKARTLFQVGSYDACSLALQQCLCTATLYSIDAALPVLRAWLGRTQVNLGELASGTRLLSSLPESPEVMLFLAEGALFSDALSDASRFLERGLALEPGHRFPLPEGVSWRDGFAAVEGRCFPLGRGDALLRRSLGGLRAYLLGLRGYRAEAIRELRQLTRGEKAVEMDPLLTWFNFLYSRVLPETGSEETDDKVTVLSKSLKGLQERASRIEAPADRHSYLWRSSWNRMIMEEARERKLV